MFATPIDAFYTHRFELEFAYSLAAQVKMQFVGGPLLFKNLVPLHAISCN